MGLLGVIVGGLAIVVAVVFGLIAMHQAKVANQRSEQANQLAECADENAVAARALAAEANRLAVDANQLGEEANLIVKRGESRETERNDVKWKGDWIEPGRYRIINKGTDEACDVRGVVIVDDEEVDCFEARVAEGEWLVFELPGAAQQFVRDRREREAAERRDRDSPYLLSSAVYLQQWHVIDERVVWKTPLGKQCVHEFKNTLGSLT